MKQTALRPDFGIKLNLGLPVLSANWKEVMLDMNNPNALITGTNRTERDKWIKHIIKSMQEEYEMETMRFIAFTPGTKNSTCWSPLIKEDDFFMMCETYTCNDIIERITDLINTRVAIIETFGHGNIAEFNGHQGDTTYLKHTVFIIDDYDQSFWDGEATKSMQQAMKAAELAGIYFIISSRFNYSSLGEAVQGSCNVKISIRGIYPESCIPEAARLVDDRFAYATIRTFKDEPRLYELPTAV